jgi:hypothetical protein
MSTATILTNALIDHVLQEQRWELRPSKPQGHAAWPFRADTPLASVTDAGSCRVGWIERVRQTTTYPLRYQVGWQVDKGGVRLQRERPSPI